MKFLLKRLMPLFLIPLMTYACSDDNTNDPPPDENKPPQCLITSPENGAELPVTENLVIRGTFSDPEDKVAKVTLKWGENNSEAIGASPFVHQVLAGELVPGTITIRLEVEDDKGEKASHEVTVIIVEEEITESVLTDSRDGNRYETVTVGQQTWMAENLRYLPRVDNDVDTYEPRFYVFNYSGTDVEEAKKSSYYAGGVYYNFYGALNGDEPTSGDETQYVKGICPDGWHLPRQTEWEALRDYVADNDLTAVDYAGRPIPDAYAKAVASKEGWVFPSDSEVPPADGHVAKDPHLNNATGFNGKPVGFLAADNNWYHEGLSCGWWTSKVREDADYYSKPTRMWSNDIYFSMGIYDFHTSCALPVRCIKD